MTLEQIAIGSLAVWRVSYLITNEEGAFSLFAKLRGRIDPTQDTWIGRGLRCVLCVSFWLSGLAALIAGGSWVDWLAIAGAVLAWHKLTTRG